VRERALSSSQANGRTRAGPRDRAYTDEDADDVSPIDARSGSTDWNKHGLVPQRYAVLHRHQDRDRREAKH